MAVISSVLVLLSLVLGSAAVDWNVTTPLDEYVNRPDPNYAFTIIGEYNRTDPEPHTILIINMTSQQWKTEEETNYPIWWHYVIMSIPQSIRYTESAFIMIDNGEMHSPVPTPDNDNRVTSAVGYSLGLGAVAAHIKMIPVQPVQITEDDLGDTRREDDFIAWTWRRFLENTSDPEILLRLPMTKAVVRCMDTMQTVAKQYRPNVDIKEFFLAGGSKRGWTAWTTAAVDRRVFAIAPSVMSIFNINENMHHHHQSMGGWTWAYQDYYREGCMGWADTPELQMMADVVDPYEYRERLTMPKYMIQSTGDQLFLPDDTHYFWDDFQGPKYLWMLENAHHSIGSSKHRDLMGPVRIAFFHAVKQGFALPQLIWSRTSNLFEGILTVTCDRRPYNASVWVADSLDGARPQDLRRDFRLQIFDPENIGIIENPVIWQERPVEVVEGHPCQYRYRLPMPIIGYQAFFIKMMYEGPEGWPLYFSSEVHIIPESFPFGRCTGIQCMISPLV